VRHGTKTWQSTKEALNFVGQREGEVRRILLKRTSENPQKANFREFLFYEVG
jgi:hypothetical protein